MENLDTGFSHYLTETFKVMADMGVLLVSGNKEKCNVMTIGWGTAGVVWGKPVFIVLVRPSRYTYQFIEKTSQFTVNVPTSEMREIATFCGTVSGRDRDKFEEKNLIAYPGKEVNSPVIKQCPIKFECQVIHKNDVIPAELSPDIPEEFYPQGDYHRVYFGQIMTAYKT